MPNRHHSVHFGLDLSWGKGSSTQWVRQYFPEVVAHEKTPCSCFSAFTVAFLMASDQHGVIQDGILEPRKKGFSAKRNTFSGVTWFMAEFRASPIYVTEITVLRERGSLPS
jgi:hypothetical protein